MVFAMYGCMPPLIQMSPGGKPSVLLIVSPEQAPETGPPPVSHVTPPGVMTRMPVCFRLTLGNHDQDVPAAC